MDWKQQLRKILSELLTSLGLFGILWLLWGLWQRDLLPQVPGRRLPALIDAVLVKPLLWGLLPCVLCRTEKRKKRWFQERFPSFSCVVLLCLTLAFLHTMRLVQGLGNTYVGFDWMFVVFSISAGTVEEIGFRGCFYKTQETVVGFWPAALLSSAMFTLYHYPELFWGEGLHLLLSWRASLIFLMGVAFCAMFRRWNNLALNMVVHTVWDILSYQFCLF